MALTLRRRRVREDAARSRPPALGPFHNVTVDRVLHVVLNCLLGLVFVLAATLVYLMLRDFGNRLAS